MRTIQKRDLLGLNSFHSSWKQAKRQRVD